LQTLHKQCWGGGEIGGAVFDGVDAEADGDSYSVFSFFSERYAAATARASRVDEISPLGHWLEQIDRLARP
jgi:hypothetical protein